MGKEHYLLLCIEVNEVHIYTWFILRCLI